MESKNTGWVIINENHPMAGEKFIVKETFSRLRKDAISKFNKGSG